MLTSLHCGRISLEGRRQIFLCKKSSMEKTIKYWRKDIFLISTLTQQSQLISIICRPENYRTNRTQPWNLNRQSWKEATKINYKYDDNFKQAWVENIPSKDYQEKKNPAKEKDEKQAGRRHSPFHVFRSPFLVGVGPCSIMSDSLWPHGLQHARPPCPSPTPGACSNSSPSSGWCHPTISSSVVPFSSCLQSFPASEPFPMSQFFIIHLCYITMI